MPHFFGSAPAALCGWHKISFSQRAATWGLMTATHLPVMRRRDTDGRERTQGTRRQGRDLLRHPFICPPQYAAATFPCSQTNKSNYLKRVHPSNLTVLWLAVGYFGRFPLRAAISALIFLEKLQASFFFFFLTALVVNFKILKYRLHFCFFFCLLRAVLWLPTQSAVLATIAAARCGRCDEKSHWLWGAQ